MTRAERLKLAKAARELAMECVAGTAPDFGTGAEFRDGKPCCAMGHVAARAGIAAVGFRSPMIDVLGERGKQTWWAVASANDEARDALPWTLLWLADELESRHD